MGKSEPVLATRDFDCRLLKGFSSVLYGRLEESMHGRVSSFCETSVGDAYCFVSERATNDFDDILFDDKFRIDDQNQNRIFFIFFVELVQY